MIDNDEKNLLASLLGRQLGVPRIITRVSRPDNRRLFERVGVDVALSARGAAIASVLHHIEGGQASLLAVLEEGDGRILEFEVPSTFVGKTLRDLTIPHDSIVGAILRGSHAIVPRGTDALQAGDHLLVFSTRSSADQVRYVLQRGQVAMRLPVVIHLIGVLVRLFGPMLLVPAAVAAYTVSGPTRSALSPLPLARSSWDMRCDTPVDHRCTSQPNGCGVSKG